MKKILFIPIIFFLTLSLKATHNRSGEILYKRIAPFSTTIGNVTTPVYTYSITVIKYTDSGLSVADRCMDTVYFGDGTKGLAPRINGLMGSCSCGSVACGEIIQNNPNYVVKKSIYSITHTYSGVGNYLVYSSDPNRTVGVHNIPSSFNVLFYISSLVVINNLVAANSSPVLALAPIGQATTHICFTHNPGATDADGDSLSYEIVPCNGGGIIGYSYPETDSAGFYYINSTSGILTWCSPQFLATYNVAFQVKEWRKNTSGVYQMIGYVTRDMQIIVSAVGVVGVEESAIFKHAKLSPNPFTSMINIDLGGNYFENVESLIYTSEGKLVYSRTNKNVDGFLNFNLSKLDKGIYFIHLISDKGSFYRKLVKE